MVGCNSDKVWLTRKQVRAVAALYFLRLGRASHATHERTHAITGSAGRVVRSQWACAFATHGAPDKTCSFALVAERLTTDDDDDDDDHDDHDDHDHDHDDANDAGERHV